MHELKRLDYDVLAAKAPRTFGGMDNITCDELTPNARKF